MNEPAPSADAALRRVATDVAAAQERARRATEFRQALDATRGVGQHRGVTVTLDSAGGLQDLALPRDFDERTATGLRDDILAAVRAAQVDVSARVRREAERSFGADSDVTRRMDAELRQRFGDV
ncbi:MAG: hypothetical protein ACXVWZ_07645 [Nocardioides sp.]